MHLKPREKTVLYLRRMFSDFSNKCSYILPNILILIYKINIKNKIMKILHVLCCKSFKPNTVVDLKRKEKKTSNKPLRQVSIAGNISASTTISAKSTECLAI